jgi:hypothetical protein
MTLFRVFSGIELAEGELFRTRETVVCESSKCSASMRRLTRSGGVEIRPFAMLVF